MKYKVGQQVKLHPLSFYIDNPDFRVNLRSLRVVECLPDSLCFIHKEMLPLLGKKFKIEEITSRYYIFSENHFHYEDWMIESPFEGMMDFFKKVEDEI